MKMTDCVVTDTMTLHHWEWPRRGDKCFCGDQEMTSEPGPSKYAEKPTLDDEQGALLMDQQTLRGLEYIFRDFAI